MVLFCTKSGMICVRSDQMTEKKTIRELALQLKDKGINVSICKPRKSIIKEISYKSSYPKITIQS